VLNANRKQRIYIYLGIAALIGCFAGAILHLSSTYLASALGIDTVPSIASRRKGRTVAEYRSSKRKARGERSAPLSVNAKEGGSRRKAEVEEEEESL
jgi:hypothetical protein